MRDQSNSANTAIGLDGVPDHSLFYKGIEKLQEDGASWNSIYEEKAQFSESSCLGCSMDALLPVAMRTVRRLP